MVEDAIEKPAVRRSNGAMRIIIVLLLLIIVSTPLISRTIEAVYFGPRLNAPHTRFDRLSPRILSDLKTLSPRAPFAAVEYSSDAQAFLDQHISWEGTSSADADRVRELLKRHLYWRKTPGELKELMNEPDFKVLDASWIAELMKFDHWDLTANAKLRERLAQMPALDGTERITAYTTMPMPNYSELREWATLYMLQSYRAGRAKQALAHYRHAASLSNSTGTLIGQMIAVAMLKDEYTFKEVFKIDGWQLVSSDVIDAYQRVSWAWAGIGLEVWREGLPEDFKPFVQPQLGVCPAAWESGFLGFTDFLEPHFLLETDFRENFVRARAFHEELTKLCHVTALNGIWNPSGSQFKRAPYLRRFLGLSLLTVAVPDFYRIYDKKN
jgi:hypothetical protein